MLCAVGGVFLWVVSSCRRAGCPHWQLVLRLIAISALYLRTLRAQETPGVLQAPAYGLMGRTCRASLREDSVQVTRCTLSLGLARPDQVFILFTAFLVCSLVCNFTSLSAFLSTFPT